MQVVRGAPDGGVSIVIRESKRGVRSENRSDDVMLSDGAEQPRRGLLMGSFAHVTRGAGQDP